MGVDVAIGFAARSMIASAGALITSGRGGRTYNQVLEETLRVGVPNGRFRDEPVLRRAGEIDRGPQSRSNISVGINGPTYGDRIRTSTGVPTVRSAPAAQASPSVGPQTLGSPEAPSEEMGALPARDFMPPTGGGPRHIVPGSTSPPIQPKKEESSMDLGTLITDLGTAYLGARYGNSPPPQVNAGWGDVVPFPGVDVPMVDVIPESNRTCDPNKGMVWNPNANCGQGKWQKRSRRRRKRLATATDIKDIAALKNIMSPAEFKVWLATH